MKTINIFWWGMLYPGLYMEERLRTQRLRGAQNNVPRGTQPPPLNVILRDPLEKSVQWAQNSSQLTAIMVSGPSTVYHCVFTPILPFPFCNPTEEFFSTWRWKVHNRPPHKQVSLLQAILYGWHEHAMTSQKTNVRPVFAISEMFSPRCLTNVSIQELWLF